MKPHRPKPGDPPAVVVCALGGLLIGIILSGVATVVRLLGGTEAFVDLNTTYPTVVLTYLGCGIGGGVIVGLGARFVHGRWSAAVLGFVVGVPCGLAFATAMGRFPPWSVDDVVTSLIFGATLGAGVGYQYWRIFSGEI